MKTTPLKKPITVTFDCVERAIFCSALMDMPRSAKLAAFKAHGYLDGDRLARFCNATGADGAVSTQIIRQLEAQGINRSTWEPNQPIRIGSYTVEFKKGHINVGCKSVTNEQVKAVLNRLEKPARNESVIVKTYESADLAGPVLEAAKRAGFSWPGNNSDESAKRGKFLGFKGPDIAYWSESKTFSEAASCHGWGNALRLDARTQFGEILDFFKSQGKADITIMGDKVEFFTSYGEQCCRFAGEALTLSTVRDIAAKLIN